MTLRRANDQTLSRSIRLATTPDKVWALITTAASIAEWYDDWDTIEHVAVHERLEVGASFRLIRHRVGRRDTALCRVTSVEAPRRLSWVQYAPHLPTVSVEFELLVDSGDPGSTLLNHTRSWIEPDGH